MLRGVSRRGACVFLGIGMLLLLPCAASLAAKPPKVFSKADESSLMHLSNALMAFREATTINRLDTPEDFTRFIALLDKVGGECTMIADATLRKIDPEFTTQVRVNLEGGSKQLAEATRTTLKDKAQGRQPSRATAEALKEGHRRMTAFHEYYSTHISAIIEDLRKRGVEIFG